MRDLGFLTGHVTFKHLLPFSLGGPSLGETSLGETSLGETSLGEPYLVTENPQSLLVPIVGTNFQAKLYGLPMKNLPMLI